MKSSPQRLLIGIVLGFALGGCSIMPSWLGGDSEPKKSEKLTGTRLPVLKNDTALQPDAELAATTVEVPAPEANAAWAQHGGNALADVENAGLPAKLDHQGSARVGDGNEFAFKLVISPVVSDALAFAMDANGYVSAHEAANVRNVKWTSPGVKSTDDEPVMGGGLAVDKGRVFAASGKGLVVALDEAKGTEVWRQALNIPIRSSPRVESGHVYVVTVDGQTYALDEGSGAVLWTHRGINEGKGYLIEATPAATPEWAVAPYASGAVHVLHAEDGAEAWYDVVMGSEHASALSVFTGIGGDPVVKDGVLYVAGSADMFAAFQLETGRRLWDQPIGSVNNPQVSGDYVYVLTTNGEVTALNRNDGRVRWVRPLRRFKDQKDKKNPYTWNGPVMAGGRLLVAGAHGEMLEISPADGTVLATTSIPEGIYTAPVVANGVLYLVSEDATLYALY